MRTDDEIEALARSFEAATLPRPEWTHAAHLAVALWHLRRYPRDEAARRLREGIRRLNRGYGNLTGYHETITLAWVGVVARFLAEHDRGQPIAALVERLVRACGDRDYLLRFYSRPVLLSDRARASWVPPDLRPIERGMRMDLAFAVEPGLDPAEFVDVLVRSTLAERRPVGEPETIRGMLANADLIVTARVDGLLVGVSRAITDYSFCTYLSDLAVDRAYQRRGIGRALIRRTHEAAGLSTTLILLAAPAARGYYPHIGMTAHDSCWVIPRQA